MGLPSLYRAALLVTDNNRSHVFPSSNTALPVPPIFLNVSLACRTFCRFYHQPIEAQGRHFAQMMLPHLIHDLVKDNASRYLFSERWEQSHPLYGPSISLCRPESLYRP